MTEIHQWYNAGFIEFGSGVEIIIASSFDFILSFMIADILFKDPDAMSNWLGGNLWFILIQFLSIIVLKTQ